MIDIHCYILKKNIPKNLSVRVKLLNVVYAIYSVKMFCMLEVFLKTKSAFLSFLKVKFSNVKFLKNKFGDVKFLKAKFGNVKLLKTKFGKVFKG